MECTLVLRRALLAVGLTCMALESNGAGRTLAESLQSDPALDLLLTRAAQDILEQHQVRTSRSTAVSVTASVDIQRRQLVIRFGPGILPDEDDHSLEELEQYVGNTLEAYALHAGVGEVQTSILYEGKPYWEHFPQETGSVLQGSATQEGEAVLVSAGHGLVRVHPGMQWEFQRPLSNGVQEDLITSGYADELQQLLQTRGGLAVHRVRRNSVDAHPDAMRPWNEMSARYHLKALLPKRTDIWNHFADSTANDREVKDDIRARPHYANELGVGGMLSLHTNADVPGVARGTRVFYHATKPGDRVLADLALCYMRELITAQEAYADFPVPADSATAGHGENRFAAMPSVVVEVAFHTNASDAAALQDPVFRTASMKGVEKGYRLFREGKDCQPLAADPIESIRLSQGQEQQVDVPFKGYPQYPIELITTNAGCPPGWTCTDGKVHIEAEGAKPSQVTMRCDNGRSGPTFWETRVVDADGVKSPAVRHSVQCIRNSRDVDGLVDPIGTITAVSS